MVKIVLHNDTNKVLLDFRDIISRPQRAPLHCHTVSPIMP